VTELIFLLETGSFFIQKIKIYTYS